LTDIVWSAPVSADWTSADVPHRIEYRIGEGLWEPLPESGRLPVVAQTGKTVRFAFRAVEEDESADPEPLTTTVNVKVAIDEAIQDRIVRIMAEDDAARQQAIEDLKTVAAPAVEQLGREMRKLREQIRQATTSGPASTVEELTPMLVKLQEALDTLLIRQFQDQEKAWH
jgi:hypothetical protein